MCRLIYLFTHSVQQPYKHNITILIYNPRCVFAIFSKHNHSFVLHAQTSTCGLVLIKETPLICPIIGIDATTTTTSTNGQPNDNSNNDVKPDANGSNISIGGGNTDTGKSTTGAGSSIGIINK